jgi:RND superfamily putative drug exporter
MFRRIGRFAAARPGLVCAAWLLAGLAVALAAPRWDSRAQDDDVRFLPERCPSVRGYKLLQEAFPQDVFACKLIFAVEREAGPLTAADLALIDGLAADLNRLRDEDETLRLGRVLSPSEPFIGERLVSADRRCALVQAALGTPYLALQTRATVDRAEQAVRRRLEGVSDPPDVYTTGQAGVGRDLTAAGADSLDSTTVVTVVLVVVILLLVYRAPLLALVPLLTIAASVFLALKLLALCTLLPGFYLVNISQVFAVVMLYGAGTDYCLFLISRYREELAKGHEPRQALARSVGGVGGALTASAGTVVCGLGLMGLAEFAKVRCAGPAIAVGLAVALVGSLTLTPALLRLLGPAVFWPVGPPRPGARPRLDVWAWLSRGVVRRPLLVWGVCLAALAPLALLGGRVRANYRATGELAPRCGSVRGLAAIQRHFTAGEVGPITVLLESDVSWDTTTGRAAVSYLSRGFGLLDNVAEVRSLTQPLGRPVEVKADRPTPAFLGTAPRLQGAWKAVAGGLDEQVRKGARDAYLATVPGPAGPRYVTRLDVVPRTDPFEPQSARTLETIQAWLRDRRPGRADGVGDVRAECYGVTVSARDLAAVTEADRTRINGLALAGIFLILLVVVRRPWLALYLLATVLLSYYATLGATTLLAHWWHGRALGEVDWRVPFFLFTILVAVGEDYNILLLTRALQERARHGARKGMRRALARTGGTISSCGLIMAGTFATLMLSGLSTLAQIGFALAFGVLLDTFVVRPFLVPALTYWAWRRQEGPPAPRAAAAEPAALQQEPLRRAG